MTISLQAVKDALQNPNVAAFLRVIRERESGQSPDAYTVINGGAHFTDFSKHPFDDIPTTRGGKASGAYQFLGTTWANLREQYAFPDFGPETQDLGAVALIAGRGALNDVLAGRLESACIKCRPEWTSLPGAAEASASWTMDKARAVYVNYGGTIDNAELIEPAPQPEPQPEKSSMPLPILALISAFGPQLIAMIPQFAALFDHKTSTPEKLSAATKALDIVVQASGATNVQDAVEKMQADPTLIKTVTNAVVTDSTIQPMLSIVEIGGGIAGAREADRAQQDSDKPFYKTSAVFWISLMLMPMVLWYVGSSIVGGIDIPPDWPWYAQLPLKLFGTSWDAGAKVGLANLVVGMILGGIVGVYYGVSVTQSKQQLPTKDQA